MRYCKTALLIFGAGTLLGLVAVTGELRWLGPVASGLMALGIVALPVAIIADLRRRAATPRASAQPRRGKRSARRPRPRKSAGPRR